MKALLAACVACATILIGVIWLVDGHTSGVTVPDAKPVAMPDVAASFEPSVPGSFLVRGFPFPGFRDNASSAEPSTIDAGAEKASAPALAAAPETPVEVTGSLGAVSPAVSA